MDTTKVIVTLLILTMVLSVATIAFNALSSNKTVSAPKLQGGDTATVSLTVEGGQPAIEGGNVGLFVEG